MTLPARMTVIAIKAPGGPEMLVPEERPVPAPGPGEILVKVAAAGVNRPDVRQRQGSYPPPKGATDIPTIVRAIYIGIDPRLTGAAGLSVLAHMEDLVTRGLVETDGAPAIDGTYRLIG